MSTRRSFIAGMLASGFFPLPTWAEAGSPVFLSAGLRPDGTYVLCGLGASGEITFELPLPARGHAAAAHPTLAQAVAFARRPGRFALVIDCVTGRELARLAAPAGRHFYGHGTFSADGDLLFTTENDYETARGIVGIWDARHRYKRLGEFSSGGIGPHDIRRVPGSDTLVVANGGIETHPETGRAKLNIPTMRPNLSYLSYSGTLQDSAEPPEEMHRNSIRHLSVRRDGLVAAACQWQGDLGDVPALLATHRPGEPLHFHASATDLERKMQGYVGSVAVSQDGEQIAITGPRGGLASVFDVAGRYTGFLDEPDICGTAALPDGFAFTTGKGFVLFDRPDAGRPVRQNLQWDNHLVAGAV